MDINAINAQRAKLGKAPISGGGAAAPAQEQDPILARAQSIRDSQSNTQRGARDMSNAAKRAEAFRQDPIKNSVLGKLSAIPGEYMERLSGTTERLKEAQYRGMSKPEAGARAAVAGAGAIGGAVGSAIGAFVPDTIEEKLGETVSGAVPEGVKSWYKGLDKNNQALIMDLLDATNVVPVAGAGAIAKAGASAAKAVKKIAPSALDAAGASTLTSNAINAIRSKGRQMLATAEKMEVEEIVDAIRPPSLLSGGGKAGAEFRANAEIIPTSKLGELTTLGRIGVKATKDELAMAGAIKNAIPNVDMKNIFDLPDAIRGAVSRLETQVQDVITMSGPNGLKGKVVGPSTVITKLGEAAEKLKKDITLDKNVSATVDDVQGKLLAKVSDAQTLEDQLRSLRDVNEIVAPYMEQIAKAIDRGAGDPIELTSMQRVVREFRTAIRESLLENVNKINPQAAKSIDALLKEQHHLLDAEDYAKQAKSEAVRSSQRTPLTKMQDRITDLYNQGGDIGLIFAGYALLDFFGMSPVPEEYRNILRGVLVVGGTAVIAGKRLQAADVKRAFGAALIKHADQMTEMQRNGVVKTIEALAKVEAGVELDDATMKELLGPSTSEYVPTEELPTIEMGPGAPKSNSGLPTVNADDATVPSASQLPDAPAPEYEPYAKELPTIDMGSGKAPKPAPSNEPTIDYENRPPLMVGRNAGASKIPLRTKPADIDARLTDVLDDMPDEKTILALDRIEKIIEKGMAQDSLQWEMVKKKFDRARASVDAKVLENESLQEALKAKLPPRTKPLTPDAVREMSIDELKALSRNILIKTVQELEGKPGIAAKRKVLKAMNE